MTIDEKKHVPKQIILGLLLFLLIQCKTPVQNKHKTMEHKHTNDLIKESSPYLLQHAHNPVNWHAWNDETLELAKKQNKPLLISVGYSACHWCHVMEHESFEDEEVAKIMNEYFVCVKVDREERPDVDQVYMSAVQLITGSGGWPLNCFALPDGRPFHGGTYFRKNQWIQVLKSVHAEFTNNPKKLENFAARLTKGVVQGNIVPQNNNKSQSYKNELSEMVKKWKESMDFEWGGPNREPKFPLPNNYDFLLKYGFSTKDSALVNYVSTSLKRMSDGGLYDQIGGGFARYSTDKYWKVPHFEKMLYDNAQLLSLYAHSMQVAQNERTKEILEQTIHFIDTELRDKTGAFYSALDADSEGEEGKFYIWSKEELQDLLGEDYGLLADIFHLNNFGEWEGDYILMKNLEDEEIIKKHHLSEQQLQLKKSQINRQLMQVRSKRIKPGLDDKSLTSWNALTTSGLIDVFKATRMLKAKELAQANLNFIANQQVQQSGKIWHSYKNKKSSINGFIEDYAFVIQAYLDWYEISSESKYLSESVRLMEYAITNYYDSEQKMFRFNEKSDEQLIVNSIEYQDNVMPSANSVMAKNLKRLFLLNGNIEFRDYADSMIHNIAPLISRYGSAFSNWSQLIMEEEFPHYEVVIVGKNAEEIAFKFHEKYLPNCTILWSEKESNDYVFQDRYSEGETLIYVCQNNACKKPVEASKYLEVIEQIKP